MKSMDPNRSYNPEERFGSLVGKVYTMPDGWDLSSMPDTPPVSDEENQAIGAALEQGPSGEEVQPIEWQLDPYFGEESVAPRRFFSTY
jgi:hypothetical protein